MDRSSEKVQDKKEPTENSVLCTLYFEQPCFTADTILTQSLGLRNQRRDQYRREKNTHFCTPQVQVWRLYCQVKYRKMYLWSVLLLCEC